MFSVTQDKYGQYFLSEVTDFTIVSGEELHCVIENEEGNVFLTSFPACLENYG
jgi:hypothetical protein